MYNVFNQKLLLSFAKELLFVIRDSVINSLIKLIKR